MLGKLICNNGFNELVKGKHGYFLYNRHDMYIGKSFEYYGEYSEFEVELFKQVCMPGDVVIEVGSNIGAHTVPLAHMVGEHGVVLACEPQRMVYQTLCANLALNSLANTQAHLLAISDQDGEIAVPELDFSTMQNFGSVSLSDTDAMAKQCAMVKMVTLDSFVNTTALKMIKIDVEGMEASVIRGATRLIDAFKPVLYVENDRLEKSKELIELIWSLGYKVFWHVVPLYNPDNFAEFFQDVLGNTVAVNMLAVPNDSPWVLSDYEEITDSSAHPFAA